MIPAINNNNNSNIIDKKYVVTIITNGIGQMLFIKRKDNHKWSLCAGGIEPNETLEQAARREILEETGLTPEYLSPIFESHNPNVTFFSAHCQGIPHNRNDPDEEGEPMWVDVRQGIPQNIYNKLSGPEGETNILRQLFQKEFKLEKCELTWLDAGFMDLRKDEPRQHIPLASTQKAPKKLSIAHKPKESAFKNLLVVHNLSQDNLQHAHEIGGLAAPSIAIHHKDHPFDSYGEVTLVAHPDLVDPKKTPVYDTDAYTARHPRPNYKINKTALTNVIKELRPHSLKVGEEANLLNNLEDNIRDRGVREAIETSGMPYVLKAAYLHEKGHPISPVIKNTHVEHGIVREKPMQDFFLKHKPPIYGAADEEYVNEMTKAFKESVPHHVARKMKEGAWKDDSETPEETEGTKRYLAALELKKLNEEGKLDDWTVNNLGRSYGDLGKTEIDRWGTQALVDKKMKDLGLDGDYEKWAINKVKPAQDTPYIPKGRRKLPYNLDTILKEMTKGKVRGSESSNALKGTGFTRSQGATKFKDLNHIKDSQGRLLSYEQMEAAKKANFNKFHKIADQLASYHSTGGMHANDAAIEALGESLKPGRSLKNELVRSGFDDVPSDLVEQLKDYGKDLVNMGTEYFEAKPQRAVGIHEFKGAAVPEDAKPETLETLKNHGIKHIERYNRNNVGDRLRAVNKIADENDLKLSESEVGFEELKK